MKSLTCKHANLHSDRILYSIPNFTEYCMKCKKCICKLQKSWIHLRWKMLPDRYIPKQHHPRSPSITCHGGIGLQKHPYVSKEPWCPDMLITEHIPRTRSCGVGRGIVLFPQASRWSIAAVASPSSDRASLFKSQDEKTNRQLIVSECLIA